MSALRAGILSLILGLILAGRSFGAEGQPVFPFDTDWEATGAASVGEASDAATSGYVIRSPFIGKRGEILPVQNAWAEPVPQTSVSCPTTDGSNAWHCPWEKQSGCADGDRLFGVVLRSERQFAEFISPQSNPFFFEDPRTLSEIRFHVINQWIPGSNPTFQGGETRMLAAQIRAALTDRLSFIGTKSGYLWIQPDNQLLPNQDGWADIAAGLKYNLIRDPDAKRLLSAGLTFEFDNGAHKVLQGFGDGEFHPFVTGGVEFFERAHFLSATGFRLPTDTVDRSQMWYWSNHLDYQLTDTLYSVVELNWYHWMKSGQRLPGVGFEGGDIFNLGSGDVAGNDIVTLSLGGRFNIFDNTEWGVAYEIPVTQRKDMMQGRLYVDFIVRF